MVKNKVLHTRSSGLHDDRIRRRKNKIRKYKKKGLTTLPKHSKIILGQSYKTVVLKTAPNGYAVVAE